METYWNDDHRCIFCGAGDDNHHSFSCETGFHPNRRSNAERYLFGRIAALEAENERLKAQLSELREAAAWYVEVSKTKLPLKPSMSDLYGLGYNKAFWRSREIWKDSDYEFSKTKFEAETALRALVIKGRSSDASFQFAH